MFDFLKRKKTTSESLDTPTEKTTPPSPRYHFFSRLKQSLIKTRHQFSEGLSRLLHGKKELNAELLNEIETLLLTADIGVTTTAYLLESLTQKLARKELNNAEAAFHYLKEEMKAILLHSNQPLQIIPSGRPFVILVVGINGSGKTTTIGKIAHYFKPHHRIMLAAGDTFRAAATQQLQIWGSRNHIPVIAQASGADTAAVIYDALESAKAKGIDLLIADTAGRLHTQSNLMSELKKVKRVLAKIDPAAPHETLIVLDATIGQNALNQVKQFNAEIGVTGIALTKLDGTAKGGIIFAIAKETGLPIRFIGVGEDITDLRPFQAEEFVEALFS